MVTKRNDTTVEARTFLQSGKLDELDPKQVVTACDQLVRSTTEKSSTEAIELGRLFVRRAETLGRDAKATALRALAWALLVGGKYPDARNRYLAARNLLINDPTARARIDRALVDVLMYMGRHRDALRRAQMAMRTFQRLGAEADLAKTKVNYANVLHRQDRHHEANKLYHEAGDYFDTGGAPLAAAICWYNEANTLVQLFDFEPADRLYRKARKIFQDAQHDLRSTGCLYGLAWLHMLAGEFHTALQELSECEREYLRAGQPRETVLCLLDRAETYLGLNLFIDARDSAKQAEKKARAIGIEYEAAKAAFFYGKASAALNKTRTARAALERARQGFKRDKNTGFLTAVDFAGAQLGSSRTGNAHLKEIRRRLKSGQLPLWEAICDLELMADNIEDTAVARRLAKNSAVKTVPHLLARHETILGDRRAKLGDMMTASRHWSRAADVLESVRAKLPPLDLRSSFSRHQSDPYEKLIATAAASDPSAAAAWLERYRTAGLWAVNDDLIRSNPDRARAEQSLARLAARMNAVSMHMTLDQGHRAVAQRTTGRGMQTLMKQVRMDLLKLERARASQIDHLEVIRQLINEASQKTLLVQWHCNGDDLIAFVHRNGQTQYHRFVDGVTICTELVGRWRFLVERTPYLTEKQVRKQLGDEYQLLHDIGDRLLAPLEIPQDAGQVVIIPDGALTNLPWPAIPIAGSALAERHKMVFAPSVRHLLHARTNRTDCGDVRVFVGDTRGLASARNEYGILAERFGRRVIVHDPCRRDDWPTQGDADVWHYTGHALWRTDNPFYSALLLDDGPLFAADFRLRRCRVNLVTLAACRTGQQSLLPGEESTGLVRSLLEMGAAGVLASSWAVADQQTADWMNEFYHTLTTGTDPETAVRDTSLKLRESYPSACHWAAFALFGSGQGAVLHTKS